MKKIYNLSLVGFILGIIAGLICPELFTKIGFIGDIYINLLKLIMIPVLFTGIISAVSRNSSHGLKITGKAVKLFIVMFVISFLLMMILYGILKPGVGFTFTTVEWDGVLADTSLAGFLINAIPNNIILAATNNAILPVIVFAFILGIILAKQESKVTIEFFTELSQAFNKFLEYIMCITPLGVFALMGNAMASYGNMALASCATYILMAYLGCLIIMIAVMIIPVWIIAKINPLNYIKNIYQIWITTLSTCSSAATLPATIKICNENFNIPNKITNIVVPLGCTIHMCGGAVSFCLLAMFNMQMYDVPMTFGLFISMLIAATLINMGAPGIPGGGIIIGATFLSILGLPLEFIGLYAGFYRILDMAYTTMNVTGDITANILINKSVN